jgi:hypothetical protein
MEVDGEMREALDKVIQALMIFDEETQERILQTVRAFFGIKKSGETK